MTPGNGFSRFRHQKDRASCKVTPVPSRRPLGSSPGFFTDDQLPSSQQRSTFLARVTVDSDSARFSRALRSAILWPVGVIFAAAISLLMIIVGLFHVVKWSDHS